MESTVPTRKALMEKISSLGSTEHAEIFRILKKHGVSHTQNKNGVFVDITTVSDDIVKEVSDFVTFCFRNNKELEEYDKRLNQCKLYQNLDCMSAGLAPAFVAPEDAEGPTAGLNVNNVIKHNIMSKRTPNGDTSTELQKQANNNNNNTSSMHRFLESLENTMDSQGRRQQAVGNTKYAAARKKYSKRVMADVSRSSRAGAAEAPNNGASCMQELKPEPYIIV